MTASWVLRKTISFSYTKPKVVDLNGGDLILIIWWQVIYQHLKQNNIIHPHKLAQFNIGPKLVTAGLSESVIFGWLSEFHP